LGFVEGLKAAGFSLAEAMEAGYLLPELVRCGYASTELLNAGFTSAQVVSSLTAAKAAGMTAGQLKLAGYTLAEMKKAGYTAAEAKQAGYTLAEMKRAGYGDELDSPPTGRPFYVKHTDGPHAGKYWMLPDDKWQRSHGFGACKAISPMAADKSSALTFTRHTAAPPARTSSRKASGSQWFVLKEAGGRYVSYCWGTHQIVTYPSGTDWGSHGQALQFCCVDGSMKTDPGASGEADPPYEERFVMAASAYDSLAATATEKNTGFIFELA